jgi:hypothetical protein
MEIRLELRYRPDDPDTFVSYATIPDMDQVPEVVLWGERIFVCSDTVCGLPGGRLCPIYREGLLWRIADPAPRAVTASASVRAS